MSRQQTIPSAILSIRILSLNLRRLSSGKLPGWLRSGCSKSWMQFDHDSSRWTAKQYRRKVIRHTLTPQLTEEEATRLLRISAIQAVYNAQAYCRGFDQLTASQQMALSQLVFQMGTNLEEFVEFLGALNDENGARELPRLDGYLETEAEHWRTVQGTLIDSQWARRYTIRAATVIAMFDPDYNQAPSAAEQRVEAVLRPPVVYRPKNRPAATLRVASYSKRSGEVARQKSGPLPGKTKADLNPHHGRGCVFAAKHRTLNREVGYAARQAR